MGNKLRLRRSVSTAAVLSRTTPSALRIACALAEAAIETLRPHDAPMTISPSPAADLPRSRAWALTLVATLTMAISYFDRQTLAVLAPTVTKALAINETQYGWLAS